jgi:hypothetical protein
MPFCRKCGRRLVEYSESCPECGTSTTAPLVKIKKAPAAGMFKAVASPQVAKAIIPAKAAISVKAITPRKPAKVAVQAKAVTEAKSIILAKPIVPEKVYPDHEIIKSNVSLKEDLIANPQDYETQTFGFDLKCPHDHFWPAGKALPVSNGKALCLKCGEQLRKPKRNKRHKYRRF